LKLSHALRVQPQDTVALVGAGGKTSAMFRLGDELAAQGWRVALTTSTRIAADQVALAPHTLVLSEGSVDQPIDQRFTHSPTLLLSEIKPQINKAIGLEPALIDQIASSASVDVMVNEADGARELPFKAPADHEPVVTLGTTLLVIVVGVDAIGRPLDGAHVHRPERVAALSSAKLGQPVTPETIAAVLTHPQGGLKGAPPEARVTVLINKVNTQAEVEAAERLAGLLLRCPRVQSVAIGAIQEADPVRLVKSRVALVVLAAGESRRFGHLKQLQPWGDGTLLTRAVDVALASQACPVIVVLGCQAGACQAILADRPVKTVVNPHWAGGQSTSVRAALAALPENVNAAIFHLADQPGVTPAVLQALLKRHEATLAPVVWPEYQGQRGNPVLFDCVAFPQLQELSGDTGGKPVLLAYARAGTAQRVTVDEPGILLDIDSPHDVPPQST